MIKNNSGKANAIDNDTALRDWLAENQPALDATAAAGLISDDTQKPAHYQNNLETPLTIKADYEQRIEAQLAAAAEAEYQEDPGLRMLEERGSKFAQTDALDSILFVNGKIVGEPHQDTLSKITIPPRDACNSLVFHADYLTPEYNYSYITIRVSAMAKRRRHLAAELTVLGKIEVPMVRCQSIQPKIETLRRPQPPNCLVLRSAPTWLQSTRSLGLLASSGKTARLPNPTRRSKSFS